MQFKTVALAAALLLVETVSAKAISYRPRVRSPLINSEDIMRREVEKFDRDLERRDISATSTSATAIASNSTVNSTQIATACMSAVGAMTTVSNEAGFAGCYNIITWDPKTSMFQADLRIYQQGDPSGDFAAVSANEVTVMLTFPQGTQYNAMMKRSAIQLSTRDNNIVQYQQYSLAGSLNQKLDTAKLNQTLLASLMVPQITLQATLASTQKTVTTNMTAQDTAWFVAGQFSSLEAEATQVANPTTASVAATAAAAFVIPGQTLGIFPTGLIITSIWTTVFLVAFGVGTIGRMKSRDLYRKRIIGLRKQIG